MKNEKASQESQIKVLPSFDRGSNPLNGYGYRYLDAFANLFAVKPPVTGVIFHQDTFFLSYNGDPYGDQQEKQGKKQNNQEGKTKDTLTVVQEITNEINYLLSQVKDNNSWTICVDKLLNLYLNNNHFKNDLKYINSDIIKDKLECLKSTVTQTMRIESYRTLLDILKKDTVDQNVPNKLSEYDKAVLFRPIQDISKLLHHLINNGFTKINVEVLPNPKGFHVEMNIASNFPNHKGYMGVSILCCVGCDYYLNLFDWPHRGTHGKLAIDQWDSPLFSNVIKEKLLGIACILAQNQKNILGELCSSLKILNQQNKDEVDKKIETDKEGIIRLLCSYQELIKKVQGEINSLINEDSHLNLTATKENSASSKGKGLSGIASALGEVNTSLISNIKEQEGKTFTSSLNKVVEFVQKSIEYVDTKVNLLSEEKVLRDKQKLQELCSAEKNLIDTINNIKSILSDRLEPEIKNKLKALDNISSCSPTRRLSIDKNIEEQIKLILSPISLSTNENEVEITLYNLKIGLELIGQAAQLDASDI